MLKTKHWKLYIVTLVLFVVYLLLLVWVILFKMEFSLKTLRIAVRAYNLIPFHYDVEHNVRFHVYEVLGNVLAFIPAGIYMELLFRRMSLWKKIALIFIFSLEMECVQYLLWIGRFDITDLITNTAGGCAGIAIYRIGSALIRDGRKPERWIAILINVLTILVAGGLCAIVFMG